MHSSTFVSGLMALGFAAAGKFANTTTPTAGPTATDSGVVVVTETLTALTTFCPAATEITTNGKTYTVTEATTLTITDCPCTVKHTSTPGLPTPTPINPGTNDTIVWTTEVVDVYTTYCPAPTQVTQGTKTYTVTAPTTLTITDCPCTISKPVLTTAVPVSVSPTPYQNATVIYTTEVVETLTTYCPAPTTLVVGPSSYTVTAPTTLTISEGCPCTVTKPLTTAPYVPTSVPTTNTPVAPISSAVHTPIVNPGPSNTIVTGGASSLGASIMAWVAAAAFAIAA